MPLAAPAWGSAGQWTANQLLDVAPNGDLSVKAQVEDVTGIYPRDYPPLPNGLFTVAANGRWTRADISLGGVVGIPMLFPHFYAGGLVIGVGSGGGAVATMRAAVVVIGNDHYALRYKPIGVGIETEFGSPDLDAARIQPLTNNDYGIGCRTYSRKQPTKVEPTLVSYAGYVVDSCLADPEME